MPETIHTEISRDPETDSLYIRLKDSPIEHSVEYHPDVILDIDHQGNLAGIDLQHLSQLGLNTDGIPEPSPHTWQPPTGGLVFVPETLTKS